MSRTKRKPARAKKKVAGLLITRNLARKPASVAIPMAELAELALRALPDLRSPAPPRRSEMSHVGRKRARKRVPKACACGFHADAPMSGCEIATLTRLRGRKLRLCALCKHEVEEPKKAHDVRRLSHDRGRLAHAICVRGARQS